MARENPFSKVPCVAPRNLNITNCSREQALTSIPHGLTTLPNHMEYQNTVSRQVMNQRTMFDDHKNPHVQDWVVNNPTELSPRFDSICSLQAGPSQPSDGFNAQYTPSMISACPISMSDDGLFSGFVADDITNSGSGNMFPATGFSHTFSDDGSSSSEQVAFPWPATDSPIFDVASPVDMFYTTSSLDKPQSQNWPTQTAWSSPSTISMEPSLASSYSQGSMFSQQLGSPISLTSQEDLSEVASNDDGVLSPLSLGGPAQGSFSAAMIDPQFETSRFVYSQHLSVTSLTPAAHSTLRPSNGFPRAPLSNLPYPMSCGSPVVAGPVDFFPYRRSSSDGDNTSARNNELYQIGPKKDGLYHCPFETSDGCTHKPEKLKCNYE